MFLRLQTLTKGWTLLYCICSYLFLLRRKFFLLRNDATRKIEEMTATKWKWNEQKFFFLFSFRNVCAAIHQSKGINESRPALLNRPFRTLLNLWREDGLFSQTIWKSFVFFISSSSFSFRDEYENYKSLFDCCPWRRLKRNILIKSWGFFSLQRNSLAAWFI